MERIFFCGDCRKFFFEECDETVYFSRCKHCEGTTTITCNITKETYDNYSDEEKDSFKRKIKSSYMNNEAIVAARKEIVAQREEKAKREKEEIAERRRAEVERKKAEAERATIEALKKSGAEGYYQYKAISLIDESTLYRSNSGSVDTEAMTQILNTMGMQGWRLVTAYSNELGKNTMSSGVGGIVQGTNSTIDENILIFERFVRF